MVSEIVIATTVHKTDDPICALARRLKVRSYRGSEEDVLSRVLGAARSAGLDIVVHLTGDCPFSDPGIIDKMVRFFLASKTDYVKNFQWGKDADAALSFPNGLDVEVFYTRSLQKADKLADDPWLRQHVTEPFYTRPDFTSATLAADRSIAGPGIRICLDTKEDLVVINKIFVHFMRKGEFFTGEDIVRFLKKNPQIMKINNRIRQNKHSAAVIGLGNIGSLYDLDKKMAGVNTHSGAYMRWSQTHLVAGCDPDPLKRILFKKKWGINAVFSDPEVMLKTTKPEIVSVCTPVDSHASIVRLCVKHGVKAILCEKPFVRDVRTGEQTINLCLKKNVILAVNHWMRYSDVYQGLKENLRKNIIGRVFLVRYHYSKGIFNSGSHAIDILRYLFGDVKSVIATGSRVLDTGDTNISGILNFCNGITVHLTCGDYRCHFTTEIDIMGCKGRIRLADNDRIAEFYKSGRSLYESGIQELKLQKAMPFNIKRGEYMVNAVSNLTDALEGSGMVRCSGEDALQAIKIIAKLRLSLRRQSSWEKVS